MGGCVCLRAYRGWAAVDSSSEMVGYLCSEAKGNSISELHGTTDMVEAAMVSAWVSNFHRTYHTVDADTIIFAGGQCMPLSCARACWLCVRACALWLLRVMTVGRHCSSPRGGPSLSRYLRGALTLGWDVCSGASPRAYRVRSSAPLPHIMGPLISSPHQPLASRSLLSASLCLPLHLPLFLFF